MGLSDSSFTVKSARHEPRAPSTTGICGDWAASKAPQTKRKNAELRNQMDRTWPNRILLCLPHKNHTPVEAGLQFRVEGNFAPVAFAVMRLRSRIIGLVQGR